MDKEETKTFLLRTGQITVIAALNCSLVEDNKSQGMMPENSAFWSPAWARGGMLCHFFVKGLSHLQSRGVKIAP